MTPGQGQNVRVLMQEWLHVDKSYDHNI